MKNIYYIITPKVTRELQIRIRELKVPVLTSLQKMMVESMNEIGFRIAEDLTSYSLIRTFTILRTIKSISD